MIYLTDENIVGRQDVNSYTWIANAINFGFRLADQTIQNNAKKFFSFVSSPTQSYLPGFITLGAILRNRFHIDGQNLNDIRHFLRIWELGEGAELIGDNDRKYKVVQLRKKNTSQYLQKDHFRINPDLLNDIANFEIVTKKQTRNSPLFILNTGNSQNYLINNLSNYDTVMDEFFNIAGVPSDHNLAQNRIRLYLVGPKKKKYKAIYNNNIKFFQGEEQAGMTLGDLLYLDESGREIHINCFFNGVWLNPGARNPHRNRWIPNEAGLAVFDGSSAWDRWSESLQHLSKVLIFNRSSSHRRQDRMREILNQIRQNHSLEKSEVLNDHPWSSDFHAIRAFVYEYN